MKPIAISICLLFTLGLLCASVALSGTVTDIDGNVYQTVTIGTQVWMAENLKVTHYGNGDAIPHVTAAGTWSGLTTGGYCEYNDDEDNVATYGRMYNWYAVSDSRSIAPAGWHVPTDAEWQTLVDYLGGSTLAGGKIKEAGTSHWSSPNTGATNESGFSALPGGSRRADGTAYYYLTLYGYFWSSSQSGTLDAWNLCLYYTDAVAYRSYADKRAGESVRCVKDAQDVTSPARITNLHVSQISGDQITLSWTAPGDDGMNGTAAEYEKQRDNERGDTDISIFEIDGKYYALNDDSRYIECDDPKTCNDGLLAMRGKWQSFDDEEENA